MRCALVLLALVAAASATSTCGGPCDIILVIDRSGSIKKFGDSKATGYEKEQDFAKSLLGMLDTHYNTLTAGFISYSSKAQSKYGKLSANIPQVITNIDKMPQGGGTNTHLGIQAGTSYLKSSGRSNVSCKKMYVITDGRSRKTGATKDAAKAARAAGIEVWAIGVGSGIKGNKKAEAEMKGIASDPDSTFFVEADDFQAAFNKMKAADTCLPAVDPCVGLPSVHGGIGTWTCNKQVPGQPGHYNHTSACTLKCPTGSTNPGNGQATCNNGTWAGVDDDKCPAPGCTGLPPPVTGGVWSCPSPMAYAGTCTLNCTHGLQSGDGLARCNNGVLENKVVDVCDTDDCPVGSWSYQGSTYMFTKKKDTWSQAAVEATNAGGYLATITSQGEQDWINTNLLGKKAIMNHEFWIGLYAPRATWMWSSGAPMAYTNWATGVSPTGANNHYTVMNEAFLASKDARDLGKWSIEDAGTDPECGLIEVPPPVVCMCNTLPPKANPSQCAPSECSTLKAKNVYSFVMCRFNFPTEFGTWTETSPNHYTSNLNAGYTCAPASTQIAATC